MQILHRNISKDTLKSKILLKVENNLVKDPQEIVEVLSKQFNTHNTTNLTNTTESIHILENSTNRVERELRWKYVTELEIKRIVNRMELKNSCGYDDIPIVVIKRNIDILAKPFSQLFNICLTENIFPDQLKIAKIIPIHKKGSKNDPKKYRPISLLPVLSKLLEKLIKARLLEHLKACNILSKRQFGYQQGVGTVEAVDALTCEVVTNLNKRLKVAGVFLDLSSAFDCVDHQILLQKLEHYGVRNEQLNLIKSYLSNRKQYVELKSINYGEELTFNSNWVDLKTGVPQGSILGPIFFIVFINDLINYIGSKIPDVTPIIYADDTNAIISASNIDELNDKINLTLQEFSIWFMNNNLIINSDKTNVMLFQSTCGKNEVLNVKLNGQHIETVDEVKFLGVNIDSRLNWKKELVSVTNKISSACYVLRSLRNEATISQLKMIYHSLVESRLRYSIKLWGNSYKYNITKAFVAQKRAIRIIFRISQRESCRDFFIKLGVLTVPCLYLLVLLCDMAKHPETVETDEERLFRLTTRRKDIPSKGGAVLPMLQVYMHSAQYQNTRLFNKLPLHLKSVSKYNHFKTNLKKWLLKKCYYSVNEFINDRSCE